MTELSTRGAVNYLVLARGTSLGAARVLAVSADQQLINNFVAALSGETEHLAERSEEYSEPSESGPLRVIRGDEQ
jgi:hypothetical protein